MSKAPIGPQLPPGFGAAIPEEKSIGPQIPSKDSESDSDDGESYGPVPPSVGPQLPPGFGAVKSIGPQIPSKDSESDSNEASYGPVLPSVGPQLPQADSSDSDSDSDGLELHDEDDLKSSAQYGPALPPGFGQKKVLGPAMPPPGAYCPPEGEDDEPVVGPAPPGQEDANAAHWANAVELRAARMRDKLLPKDQKAERESWMLELPKDRSGVKGLGLEARQFRKTAGPDQNADLSCWTDTPADKHKKKKTDRKVELEDRVGAMRDAEMAVAAKAHKRDSKSLLEQHQDKRRKGADGSSKSGERQMFDRDRDLQVNRFDDAQKKNAINKSQLLDDRFSSGHRKFL